MNEQLEIGFFGKLPAYGDFICRNIPGQIQEVWDEWLQLYVKGSQEKIGENWLDIYLTSPIWRFAFASGVLDENVWAGIVLPSVDRVGRYFPFSILARLSNATNPSSFICSQQEWFESVEKFALSALNQELELEDLLNELGSLNTLEELSYERGHNVETASNLVTRMEFEEQSPLSVFPGLLDVCLNNLLPSYSIWTTKGSEIMEPCVFVSQALPPGQGIAAMIDGAWGNWRWQEPYKLRASAPTQ